MPELLSPLELADEPEVAPADPATASELAAVRDLVVRAHPDIVPELLTGDTVAAVLASVDGARSAYARLADAWTGSQPAPVVVPAGGGEALPVDPGLLPPAEKIRRGLQTAQRRPTNGE